VVLAKPVDVRATYASLASLTNSSASSSQLLTLFGRAAAACCFGANPSGLVPVDDNAFQFHAAETDLLLDDRSHRAKTQAGFLRDLAQ
jgi:hypothetical protein